jgi:hypothetical protein
LSAINAEGVDARDVEATLHEFDPLWEQLLRIPAKEIAHSDLMSIKIEASFRWTVIC